MRASSLLAVPAVLGGVLLAACGGGQQTGGMPPASTSPVQTSAAQVQTATPVPTPNQLAYINADGNIMLVNSDGSGARKLADAGDCGRFPSLLWSPTGQNLTCFGAGAEGKGTVILMDAKGKPIMHLASLPGPGSLYWSPSGQVFAYIGDSRLFLADVSGQSVHEVVPLDQNPTTIIEDFHGLKLWSPDGLQLAYRPAQSTEMWIYSLMGGGAGGESSPVGDYRPLAWALGGKALLVAAKYAPPVDQGYPTYEADLLDPASGELTRVPELDNGRQFWVSPDGTRAAVLTQGTGGTNGYPGLAVLALPSGEFKPIRNSVITFGSDHIPGEWVTFTADGSQVYWITQWDTGTAIFKANSDATGLVKVAQFESPGAEFSPDLTMVAYHVFDDNTHTVTLYTANVDGTGIHEIDRADTGGGGFGFAPAWRPTS
jgi:hypothetical protein